MVWTVPDGKLPNLVRAPFKTCPATLNCLHDEFHNGANMRKLGEVVTRHEP